MGNNNYSSSLQGEYDLILFATWLLIKDYLWSWKVKIIENIYMKATIEANYLAVNHREKNKLVSWILVITEKYIWNVFEI